MNKLAIIAAAALTASTFGMAAIAQDTGGDFNNADGNQDGLVSWEEAHGLYPTLSEQIFNQADENGDGGLDEAEFGALQGLTAGLDNTTSSELSVTTVQQ